jgi:hypothetical protein
MKPPLSWRVWADRAVNLAMLWSGALLAGSGLAMKYRVGYDSPRGATVWGMDGEGWGRLHWVLSLVVLSLLALHLFRHRRWLWSVLVSRATFGMALILLVALLLGLLPVIAA